jgi:hypothetical protein
MILLLVLSVSFFAFVEISYSCTVASPLTCLALPLGPTYNCGFYREGADSWLCGIKKNSGTYYCQTPYSADNKGSSCESSDVLFRQSGCPNTGSYNGKECEVADGAAGCYLIVHCGSKKGSWDASERDCITCSGVKQSKVLATTSQRCYNYYAKAFPNCGLDWEEYSCASTDSGTCESACGAEPECDEATPGSGSCTKGGVAGTCDSNCVCQTGGEEPPAECSTGQSRSCTRCSGSNYCTGATQTCVSGSWGSCTGGSCSCVVGQCGATSCGGGGTYDVNFYQYGITDGSNWCVNIGGTSTICKAAFPSQSWIDHDDIPAGSTYTYTGYPTKWRCTSGCSGIINSGGSRTAYFCEPKDCDSLGKNCGIWDDECGDFVDCGDCEGRDICADGVCTTPVSCGLSGGINPAPRISCANKGPFYSSVVLGLEYGCADYGQEDECNDWCIEEYGPYATGELSDEYACGSLCGSYAEYCNDCVCTVNMDGAYCGTTYCPEDCCVGTTWYDYPDDCQRECSEEVCEPSCNSCTPTTYYNDPHCPECAEDSDCFASDTDGGINLEEKGDCSSMECDASGKCQVSYTETDTCTGSSVLEWYPSSIDPNLCSSDVLGCDPGYGCVGGECVLLPTCSFEPIEVGITVVMDEEKSISLSSEIDPEPTLGGITIDFSPDIITPPSKNSLMTITIDSQTPSGTYTITVKGTGGDAGEEVTKTKTYELVIP